jgi:hypothetical protein
MAAMSRHSFNIEPYGSMGSGSLNTILEVDHLRTIDDNVCYIGLLVSEEKISKHFFP